MEVNQDTLSETSYLIESLPPFFSLSDCVVRPLGLEHKQTTSLMDYNYVTALCITRQPNFQTGNSRQAVRKDESPAQKPFIFLQ